MKNFEQMSSYDVRDQINIVVVTWVLDNITRIHDREDVRSRWDDYNLDKFGKNANEGGSINN